MPALHCGREGEQMHGGELLSWPQLCNQHSSLLGLTGCSKKAIWNHWIWNTMGGGQASKLKAAFPLPLFSFLTEVHLLGLWLSYTSWLCPLRAATREIWASTGPIYAGCRYDRLSLSVGAAQGAPHAMASVAVASYPWEQSEPLPRSHWPGSRAGGQHPGWAWQI